LLGDDQSTSEMGIFLKTFESRLQELKTAAKAMRRRMPGSGEDASEPEALVAFPASTTLRLRNVLAALTPIVRAMHNFSRSAAQQAGLQGEPELPAGKLVELLHHAVERAFDGQPSSGGDGGPEILRAAIENASKHLADLSKTYQVNPFPLH